MKKIMAVMLWGVLLFSLTSCNEVSDTVNYEDASETTTSGSQAGVSVGKPAEADEDEMNSPSVGSSSSKTRGSSSSSSSDQSFEEYLKENDLDSYEYYKELEDGFNSGSYDSEYGFSSKANSSSSTSSKSKSSSSSSSQSFEDYLKENDSDSYKYYKGLESGFSSGSYDSENGFFQP